VRWCSQLKHVFGVAQTLEEVEDYVDAQITGPKTEKALNDLMLQLAGPPSIVEDDESVVKDSEKEDSVADHSVCCRPF
jgi:hypothetical protein